MWAVFIFYCVYTSILAFVNCGRLVAAAHVLSQSSCYTTETSAGPASAHSSDCASCCFYARRTELFLNSCKPDLADWHRCLLLRPREHRYSHRRQSTCISVLKNNKRALCQALFSLCCTYNPEPWVPSNSFQPLNFFSSVTILYVANMS